MRLGFLRSLVSVRLTHCREESCAREAALLARVDFFDHHHRHVVVHDARLPQVADVHEVVVLPLQLVPRVQGVEP